MITKTTRRFEKDERNSSRIKSVYHWVEKEGSTEDYPIFTVVITKCDNALVVTEIDSPICANKKTHVRLFPPDTNPEAIIIAMAIALMDKETFSIPLKIFIPDSRSILKNLKDMPLVEHIVAAASIDVTNKRAMIDMNTRIKAGQEPTLKLMSDCLFDCFKPLSGTVRELCKMDRLISVKMEIEQDEQLAKYHEILTNEGIKVSGNSDRERPTVIFSKGGIPVAAAHSSFQNQINATETLYGFKLSVFVPAGEYSVNVLLGKEQLSFKAICRTVCEYLGLIPKSSNSMRVFELLARDAYNNCSSNGDIPIDMLKALQVFYRIYLSYLIAELEKHIELIASRPNLAMSATGEAKARAHRLMTEYATTCQYLSNKGILYQIIPYGFAVDLREKYIEVCNQITGEN